MHRELATVLLLAVASAAGQESKPLAFDTATIKPSPPPIPGKAISSGPRDSPGRMNWVNSTLKLLLVNAYNLPFHRVEGPAWINENRWDVEATLPGRATPDQRRQMMQALLQERFQLELRFEPRVMQVYAIVIGKNGPKLDPGALPPPPPPNPDGSPAARQLSQPPNIRALADDIDRPRKKGGRPGFPVDAPPALSGFTTSGVGGNVITAWRATTLSLLAKNLTDHMDRPVVDETGLTGKYEIVLTFAPQGSSNRRPIPAAPEREIPLASDPVPTLKMALHEYGLDLVAKKTPVEVLVVVKANRVPSEN